MGYANHLKRILAFIIDSAIVFAVYGLAILLIGNAEGSRGGLMVLNMIFIFAFLLYGAIFESGKWQATPGKRITGLKVTALNGGKISMGKGILRGIGKIVDTLTYGIGFVMILWTKKRQGLHDKIASTVTVSVETDSSFFEEQGDVIMASGKEGKIAELENMRKGGILTDEEYELAVSKLKAS